MPRRNPIATKKHCSRASLIRKRSVDRLPLPDERAAESEKRARSNKFDAGEEEIGDFIIVDTGTTKEPDQIQKDENKSPKPTAGGASNVAFLQVDEVVFQTTHKTSSIDVNAMRKAQDALLILDVESTGFIEGKQTQGWSTGLSEDCISSNSAPEPNSPSSDGVRQTIWPSLSSNRPPSATDSASSLTDEHSGRLSLLPKNTPNDYQRSPQSVRLLPSSQEPSTQGIPPLPPVRQLCKIRSSNTSKISQGQGDSSADSNQPRQSSTNITRTENLISHKIGAMSRLRPEQHSHTSPLESNSPQPALPHLPATSNSAGNWASRSFQAPRWNAVSATALILPEGAHSTFNFEDVRVIACSQPLASIVPQIHEVHPTSCFPRPLGPDNNNIKKPQKHSTPIQMNYISSAAQPLNYHESIRDLSSTIHNNSTPMNNTIGVSETSRTVGDKKRLRDWAAELIAGRDDVELEEDETIGGPKRVYPDIRGAVVDKNSAKGIVVVTARGFPIRQVDTGQGVMGDSYAELIVRDGQACVTYGSSTVLYYKPRKTCFPNQVVRQSQSRETTQSQVLSIHQMLNRPPPPPIPEITVRLQIDSTGKFSLPYDMSIFRSKIKTTEFFSWFGGQTGHGGTNGPLILNFTFQNTIPAPKSMSIPRLNEDDFRYMRKDIIAQYEKAKLYVPGLREFVVLVTAPGWGFIGKGR